VPGHIPWTTIDAELRATRSIWLSTTRPDGRPHAIPLWFWWDGRDVYFIAGRATQKAKNLAHRPYAVVHAGDGDDVVILEGPVEVVRDRRRLDLVDAGYRGKYVDPGSGARASIYNEGDDCYRVNVQHVMAWAYGTIGNRTDWRFER
jgi:nitroimidazol reductase NimA-like FMN-containing flavoprotein (pyridoxamine 5'-phosphate oxidase superfamily)